jgi:hypothetical protein
MNNYYNYNINNDDLYFHSSIYNSNDKVLIDNLDSLGFNTSKYLKNINNFSDFAVLHNLYVKGRVGEGIGRRHLNNFILSCLAQNIKTIYVFADIKLFQPNYICLISFYEHFDFKEIYSDDCKFSLMKCVLS